MRALTIIAVLTILYWASGAHKVVRAFYYSLHGTSLV